MKKAARKPLNFFSMMVRLEGKKCLVVGGGKVAAEKIAGLLQHGAKVTVVSPEVTPAIQKQARLRVVGWKKRKFSPRDAMGAFLVIAATNSSAVNSGVLKASRRSGALCNSVDDPANCDFFYPAVVRRGPLQIAISTNGHSPAAAARLRGELEQQFGPEWGEWISEIGKARSDLLRREMPTSARRQQILELASEKSFRKFASRSPKSRRLR